MCIWPVGGGKMILKEIGDRVRHARLEKHMSQAELAKVLHASAPFVSNIEQGKQTMSITTLSAICEALDISADWVLRDTTPEGRKITDDEITRILSDCTPAEKSAMLKLLYNLKELLRCSK